MHNAGVKIADTPDILKTIMDDGGKTLLAVWHNAVPVEVQAAIEKYDPARHFGKKAISFSFQPRSRKKYPGLAPLFDFANDLKHAYEDVIALRKAWSVVEVMAPGTMKISKYLHRDNYTGPLNERITGICAMRSGFEARNGNFRYIDREDAKRCLIFDTESPRQLACTDEAAIQTMPMNSFALIVHGRETGLAHYGESVENGYRWRVITELPHIKPER
jgi:hypothetical protein